MRNFGMVFRDVSTEIWLCCMLATPGEWAFWTSGSILSQRPADWCLFKLSARINLLHFTKGKIELLHYFESALKCTQWLKRPKKNDVERKFFSILREFSCLNSSNNRLDNNCTRDLRWCIWIIIFVKGIKYVCVCLAFGRQIMSIY